jgi:glycosyltransferase involved in cell wall biosynthesis
LAFDLAKRLSDRLGRPYVLDYRDSWLQNPNSARFVRKSTIGQELQLMEGSSAVIAISRSLVNCDPRLNSKLHVITNGYDPDELENIDPHPFGHFAIVYTGTFYPPQRVITPVIGALARLKQMNGKEDCPWFFHYYGGQDEHVREEAMRLGVMERVILHGRVPRTEALAAVHGAGVSVVITSCGEEATFADRGIMTGKIYDALGVGTPILLVAPPGSDVDAVGGTTGLIKRFKGSDIDQMAGFLLDAMHGRVPEALNPKAYAWPRIVRKLDDVLRQNLPSGWSES